MASRKSKSKTTPNRKAAKAPRAAKVVAVISFKDSNKEIVHLSSGEIVHFTSSRRKR